MCVLSHCLLNTVLAAALCTLLSPVFPCRYLFDHALVLPEYIIEFQYTLAPGSKLATVSRPVGPLGSALTEAAQQVCCTLLCRSSSALLLSVQAPLAPTTSSSVLAPLYCVTAVHSQRLGPRAQVSILSAA